jgi:hypothetical protein
MRAASDASLLIHSYSVQLFNLTLILTRLRGALKISKRICIAIIHRMFSPSHTPLSWSPPRDSTFSEFPSYQNSPYSTPYRVSDSTPIGLIDLTADSSPYNPTSLPSVMELAPESVVEGSKRRRLNPDTFSGRLPSLVRASARQIDEVDLTTVDDDAGFKRLQEEQQIRRDQNLQKQREQQEAETIRSMHEQSRKPLRVNELQCVVCMENMTNITATHCGKRCCA